MVFANRAQSIRTASQHLDAGNPVAAEAAVRDLLSANPKDVSALRITALAAAIRRDHKKAIKLLKRCISLAPDQYVLYYDLGRFCMESSRFDEGLDAFDSALKANPSDTDTVAGRANLLEKAGRYDEAKHALQPFFDNGKATGFMAIVLANIVAREGNHEEAIRTVMPFVDGENNHPRETRLLWRIAGKSHEALGDYEKAFKAFSNANAVEARPFNRERFKKSVDDLIATFTPENLAQVARGRDQSELAIFVASMPRSGSTLVEQIIHAHPQAYGAGEIPQFSTMVRELPEKIASMHPYPECIADLTEEHADQLAAWYLKELRALGPGKKRIVDKDINNWQHAGMVSLLLPAARIINVHRDPLDNGFGIFMADLDPASLSYATDLSDIGFAYSQFRRLMGHWRSVLDVRMLDVQYEDLVEDSDTCIRKIIDFTGLKWDDRCLRYYEAKRDVVTLSYEQVRKPIYKSAVKRWRKYEAFLDPLKQALEENESD